MATVSHRGFSTTVVRNLVSRYGAKADGSYDNYQALVDAFEDLLTKEAGWAPHAAQTDKSNVIYVPTPPANGFYYVSQKVLIPHNKNFLMAGESRGSARFKLDTGSADSYLFEVQGVNGGVHRYAGFENIVFDGAGVLLAANQRPWTEFRGCHWHGTKSWCIELGQSATGLKVYDFWSIDCNGFLYAPNDNSDRMLIACGDVTRPKRVGIQVNAPCTIRDVHFEQMGIDADDDQPWINLTGSQNSVVDCEFGVEVGNALISRGPPRDMITCGPLGSTTPGSLGRLMFRGLRFRGRGTPSAASAHCAIRINKPLKGSSVIGCHFQPHNGPLVQHDEATSGTENYWLANPVNSAHSAGRFSGNHGFVEPTYGAAT